MFSRRLYKFYFSISLILFSSVALTDDSQIILGRAYDQKNGQFLYSEHHMCSNGSSQCSVEYRDDSGVLLVRKELDYRNSLNGPALRVEDYRRGTTLDVEPSERSDLVVDAGFDNFIRSKWNELAAGERVSFPFLVVGFDKPLKMVAKMDRSKPCLARELCLEISLDSWLLGLLTNPISLSYSRDEQKLLRYQGISNIRDKNGEALSVDIHYRYGEQILLSGPVVQPKISQFNF